MLIDWLTLRLKLDHLGQALHNRILDYLGIMVCVGAHGEEKWRKYALDVDALRSDSPGLYWTITADGQSQRYLTIGASPASIEHEGLNVFGSLDIQHCATVLIHHAGRALDAILPDLHHWQCRRVDVTCNYDMGNPAQVKQALRLLLATDAPRRRTNSDRKGGDTVYWNPSSDLRAGKAYHKGPHLRKQVRVGNCDCPAELLDKADNLLRLELKLGARWFRRLDKFWYNLTEADLIAEHHNFFAALLGQGLEVKDMGSLLDALKRVCPTEGRALAAHRTFAVIQSLGYTQARDSMPKSTFMRHCAYLRAAGLSSADLCAGKIVNLRTRKLIIAEPVRWWDDIKRVA